MAQETENVLNIVRGANDIYNAPSGIEVTQQCNNRGDQIMAMGLPQKAELVRMGQAWTVRIATASAFTYVAGWPTTRAEIVLYNGEAVGGKSYVIDSAYMYGITTMAAAQPITLVAQLVKVATVPTSSATQLINGRNGKKTYSGLGIVDIANTAAGQIANLWDVVASGMAPMTTNLGAALYADLWGGYIVPPGYVFALAGIAGTVAGTAIIGVTWAEVQLING
jgi:hypothetical protein